MDQWSTRKHGPALKLSLKARLSAPLTMLALKLPLKADLNQLLQVNEVFLKLRQMEYPSLTQNYWSKSVTNLHHEGHAALWVLAVSSEFSMIMVVVSSM